MGAGRTDQRRLWRMAGLFFALCAVGLLAGCGGSDDELAMDDDGNGTTDGGGSGGTLRGPAKDHDELARIVGIALRYNDPDLFMTCMAGKKSFEALFEQAGFPSAEARTRAKEEILQGSRSPVRSWDAFAKLIRTRFASLRRRGEARGLDWATVRFDKPKVKYKRILQQLPGVEAYNLLVPARGNIRGRLAEFEIALQKVVRTSAGWVISDDVKLGGLPTPDYKIPRKPPLKTKKRGDVKKSVTKW